jgi:hypothetical protein
MWDEMRDWADEGERHGIPRCCGLRFGFGAARPKLFSALGFPRLTARIGSLGLRRWAARIDQRGWVPCEAHLIWWIVSGRLRNRGLTPRPSGTSPCE